MSPYCYFVFLILVHLGFSFSTEELEYSRVWSEGHGNRNYTVHFQRRAAEAQLNSAYSRSPIIRVTRKCSTTQGDYCGIKDPGSELEADFVGAMNHAGDGSYSYNIDLSSRTGEYTPTIYYESDNTIHAFYGTPGDDFSSYNRSTTIASTTSTATGIGSFISSSFSTDSHLIYSFILYGAASGTQTFGLNYNGCMLVKINGDIRHHNISTACASDTSATAQFDFTFADTSTPYFVEAYANNLNSTSYSFDFGIGAGTPTAFTTPQTFRPQLFENSAKVTLGQSEFSVKSTKSEICFALVVIMTIIACIAGMIAYNVLNKEIIAVYSIIHYIQLLLLTPLIGHSIGNDLLDFYNQIDFFLVSFNFLGQDIVFTDYDGSKPRDGFRNDIEYLREIGLESASALYNLGQLITITILITIGILIIFFLKKMCFKKKEKESENEEEENMPRSMIEWLYDLCILDFPVRFFFLTFPFVFLCIFVEIGITNYKITETGSYVFAISLFVIYGIIGVLLLVFWILSRDEEIYDKLKPFQEVFRGCKMRFMSRSWPLMWAIRGVLFVLVMCTADTNKTLSLRLVLLINLVYLVYLGVARPFKRWVDQAVETFNTLVLEIQLFILFPHEDTEVWSTWVKDMYLSIIVLTVFIDLCLIFIWGFVKVVDALIKRRKRNRYRMARQNRESKPEEPKTEQAVEKESSKDVEGSSKEQSVPGDNKEENENII